MTTAKRFRTAVTAIAVVAASLAGAGTATALWSDQKPVVSPPVKIGGVSFAAEENPDPSREYASAAGGARQENGAPVTVTLPGQVIAGVLNGTVIWRFKAMGFATGIAGLTYDVSYPAPNARNTGVIDEIIKGTSMKVYPASDGGDCSTIPQTSPPPIGGTVTIKDTVLQAPGSNPSGNEIVQDWCVALDWIADPPQLHTNVATVTATAADGSTVTATDIFESSIDYPPSLDPFGSHTNVASVEGTGEDGTIARDEDQWSAVLYPDPNLEPDVTITLTPRVTSVA